MSSRITEVTLSIPGVTLAATFARPENPHGLILFAHGSGSSRFSPRNRFVARELEASGFATLLLDLLTPDEEDEDRYNASYRFDVALLARRLSAVARLLGRHPETAPLPIGYFGASTGAAAALLSAAEPDSRVAAVVSRGGRPDLAADGLPSVQAPTLLIVGGDDEGVLELNRGALAMLRCTKEMSIVPGATHLFEEPGALEQVATLASRWFARFLEAGSQPAVR